MNFLPTIQFPDIPLPELPGLSWFTELAQDPPAGIELGNGRTLPPEDVLEGHYTRLSTRSSTKPAAEQLSRDGAPDHAAHETTTAESDAPDASAAHHSPSPPASQSAPDDLNIAIATLAPHLAPLTKLAEDVAQTVPSIQPEPQFRADLHRALEQAHERQAAQRTLGVFVNADGEYSIFWRLVNRPTVIAGIPIVFGILIYVWRYRGAHKS